MCGIIHVRRPQGVPACKTVFKRYNQQRHRGQQGYGYVAVSKGKVVSLERAKTEAEIREKLMLEDAEEILFHHRMPTSTPNFVGATHPIVIQNDMFKYDYLVIHNGVITNADRLKTAHEALGMKYTTEYLLEKKIKKEVKEVLMFENGILEESSDDSTEYETITKDGYNDSEALAYELALVVEGWQDNVETYGGVATIFYQLEKDGQDGTVIGATVRNMFYGSNTGRPLVLELQGKKKKKKTEGEMVVIKSEGKGKEIETDRLYKIDYENDLDVSSIKMQIGNFYTKTYNAHNQSRMGYSRNEDRDPNPSDGASDTDTDTPDADDVDAMFPPVNETDDVMQLALEEGLMTELEGEEAKAWVVRADEVMEQLIDLQGEIDDVKKAVKNNPSDHDSKIQLEVYHEESILLQREWQTITDKLQEFNMPIPSLYQYQSVN